MNLDPRPALMVNVYRPADGHDCTLGGPSSLAAEVLIVGPGVDGPWNEFDGPRLKRPVLIVERFHGLLRVRPFGPGPWAFGGNFVHASDSRFAGLNNGYPIPVHDRDMTKERH